MEAHPRTPMWGGVKVFLLDDIPRRKAAMGIQRPFEPTLKWSTQKLAGVAAGLACSLGFCTSSDVMIQAFERLVAGWDLDQSAQMFMAIVMMDKLNLWGVFASQVYGKAEAEPAIFKDFRDFPTLYKTTRFANQSDLSEELSVHNDHGYR